MTTLRAGDPAPRFSTKDQHNQDVGLDDFRGRRHVLLVFYPFAFSRLCTRELDAVRDDLGTYQNDDTQILPISVDHPFALKAFADHRGYGFPLLSDFWPHGEIAQRYGVFNQGAGFALRGTFLIDKDGLLRYAAVNEPGEMRDPGHWSEALAGLR